MRSNFFYNTHADGKLPWLTYSRPAGAAWVEYRNDTPVCVKPYAGQDRVWDYAKSQMLGLGAGVLGYPGGQVLPVYQGRILEGRC